MEGLRRFFTRKSENANNTVVDREDEDNEEINLGDHVKYQNLDNKTHGIGTVVKIDNNMFLICRHDFYSNFWRSRSQIKKAKKEEIKPLENVNFDTSGNSFGWGSSQYYQLGTEESKSYYLPTHLMALDSIPISKISIGTHHTLILTDNGQIYSLGSNSFGETGIEGSDVIKVPTWITSLSNQTIIDISAGGSHNLAVTSNGSVYSWGSNEYGQLGLSIASDKVTQPTRIITLENIVKVACGENHSLAIDSFGKVWAWGRGAEMQLGIKGSRLTLKNPTLITNGLNGHFIVDACCGKWHNVVLTSEGKCLSWGSNDESALGRAGDISIPKIIRFLSKKKVIQIASGRSHSALLDSDGVLWTQGSNVMGQLGRYDYREGPDEVKFESEVSSVACGLLHTVCLMKNGDIYSFGCVLDGRLGIGQVDSSKVIFPTKVVDLSRKGITQIFAGGHHVIAIKTTTQSFLKSKLSTSVNDPTFSDVTIHTQTSKIHGHAVILSNLSLMLRNTLLNDWKPNKKIDLDLTMVTHESAWHFINFLYTGDIDRSRDIDLAQVSELSNLSELFDIESLRKWSKSVLEQNDIKKRIAFDHSSHSFFSFALNSEKMFSDATIVMKDDKVVHGHKILLCTGNETDYWKAMFTSGMKETYSQVEFDDLQESVMIELMNYLYTGSLRETSDANFLVEMLIASSRTLMIGLQSKIETIVKDYVDGSSLVDMLNLSYHLQCNSLFNSCLSYFVNACQSKSTEIENLDNLHPDIIRILSNTAKIDIEKLFINKL